MKIRHLGLLLIITFFTACVSIPKETVTLSQTLGNDIVILHHSHRNMINIHFEKIKSDINTFIDDVYAPFIIHYALKQQLEEYKNGNPSIYGTILLAGEVEGKIETENAINDMFDFQDAARKEIEKKRNELLKPIRKQQFEIINALNQSYENALYANSTLTAYLQSARKIKDTQQEALSMIGLESADTFVTESLIKVSEQVSNLVEKGNEIDVKSDDAYEQLKNITDQIKKLTNKK